MNAVDRGPDGEPRFSLFPIALLAFDPFAWTCARNSLIFATALASFLGASAFADPAIRLIFDTWPEAIAAPIAREVNNVLTVQRSDLLTYGVVQGLMTPRDLLEAITGELQPGMAADAWATPGEDGSWELDGLMPVSELRARLAIRELPDEERGRYNTVAGLLMSVSGHLPEVGERIECAGWQFEVLALDGRRIDRVRARALEEPADAKLSTQD